MSATEYATLLERRSYECYLTDQQLEGIEALEEALVYYRSAGDDFGKLRGIAPGVEDEAVRAGLDNQLRAVLHRAATDEETDRVHSWLHDQGGGYTYEGEEPWWPMRDVRGACIALAIPFHLLRKTD